MPPIAILEGGPELLGRYARISCAFQVSSIYRPAAIDGGLGGIALREEPVTPYVKDYDAQGDDPAGWPDRFDLRAWGVFLACAGDGCVGGAAVAIDPPGATGLAGRPDLAVLWDIRVQPGFRGAGIGTALFDRAVAWSRSRACRRLKIETQNVNVAACRFYAARGCRLSAIDFDFYAGVPAVAHEVMLVWYVDL